MENDLKTIDALRSLIDYAESQKLEAACTVLMKMLQEFSADISRRGTAPRTEREVRVLYPCPCVASPKAS